MPLREYFPLLRSAYRKWSADGAADLAAALSYYTIATLVPFTVLLVASLGIFFGEAGRAEVQQQIGILAGSEIGRLFADIAAATHRSNNILVATLSALITLATGIGLFNHVKATMERMWHASAARRGSFWRRFLPNAALFVLIVALGALLFAAAAAATLLSVLEDPLLFGRFAAVLDLPVFFGLAALFFFLVYRLLPDKTFPAEDLAVGAVATAVFFTLGRFVLQLYFNWRNPASIYGTASAVVLLLFWVFYSAQIFYFGVEFTAVYAKRKQTNPHHLES